MQGRKPKPTAQKIAAGNPGHRAINYDEPKYEGDVQMPDELSELAKKHWVVIASQLETAGVLQSIDSTALAMYCEAYANWARASSDIRKNGLFIRRKYKGRGKNAGTFLERNPYIAIQSEAFQQMSKLMEQFGMTPSSRTRIKAAPKKRKASVFSIIKGQNARDGGAKSAA